MNKFLKTAILGLGLMIASTAVSQPPNPDINPGDWGTIPLPPRPKDKEKEKIDLIGITYGSIKWKEVFG